MYLYLNSYFGMQFMSVLSSFQYVYNIVNNAINNFKVSVHKNLCVLPDVRLCTTSKYTYFSEIQITEGLYCVSLFLRYARFWCYNH
jgi:hypothetical protein